MEWWEVCGGVVGEGDEEEEEEEMSGGGGRRRWRWKYDGDCYEGELQGGAWG